MLINAEQGITVSLIAERLDISPTYLYKLLPALEAARSERSAKSTSRSDLGYAFSVAL